MSRIISGLRRSNRTGCGKGFFAASQRLMAGYFAGVEIGGTKLQVVVSGPELAICHRVRFTVDPDAGGAGIRSQLEKAIPELRSRFDIAAAAIGFGGPVDRNTGTISRSHQIVGWENFLLREWAESLFKCPVELENDANIAALGEAIRGAGAGANPVFYVTLGSGVGGGLVVDGKIYHGAPPGEAEIGHVRLDPGGTLVEERCSGWAVDKQIRGLQKSGQVSFLTKSLPAKEGGEARFLGPALAAGDETAIALLREVSANLAFALSHVVHLFHPQTIVLGGGLSLVGEPLRHAVEQALPQFLMHVFHGTVGIRLAALAEDSVPIGCLLAAQALTSNSTRGV